MRYWDLLYGWLCEVVHEITIESWWEKLRMGEINLVHETVLMVYGIVCGVVETVSSNVVDGMILVAMLF